MSAFPFSTAISTAIALAVGTAGGALFSLLGAPLPWTLGSLFFTALMALAGGRHFLPRLAWTIARPMVGVLAGSAFTLQVVMMIPTWWDTLLALLAYSILFTFLGWLFFTRICRYDDVTAFFASAPGGLGELTLLGGVLGGNVRTLVLVHAIRVVMMVFIVPFMLQIFLLPEGTTLKAVGSSTQVLSASDWLVLGACAVIGYFIGRPFRTLGGVMLAPMVLSAIAHISGATYAIPPDWLVAGIQVLIGGIAGARFAGTSWRELRSTMWHAVIWAVVLLVGAVIAAWLCSLFAAQPLMVLILAFTPGGLVEITIIAYALGAHVAFIVTTQICRVTLVLLLTPSLFKLFRRSRRQPAANS